MVKNIEEFKRISEPILVEYQIKRSAVFGSFARGEQKNNSDIDLLIEFKPGAGGLLEMVRLKRALEKATAVEIDLGTFNSLNKLIRSAVKKDLIQIYG